MYDGWNIINLYLKSHVQYSEHWNPFYSFLLHWEKIWCIFPKGRNCDLGVVLERVELYVKMTFNEQKMTISTLF